MTIGKTTAKLYIGVLAGLERTDGKKEREKKLKCLVTV
jgi:hypothetical protein